MEPLLVVLLGLFLEYFILLHRLSGAINQACFVTGWLIAHMDCMIFLRFPERPFLRLVGKDDFNPLRFMPWLVWLATALVVVLEGVPYL